MGFGEAIHSRPGGARRPAGSGSGVHRQDEARALYAKGKDEDLVSCFVISVSPGLVKFHVLG